MKGKQFINAVAAVFVVSASCLAIYSQANNIKIQSKLYEHATGVPVRGGVLLPRTKGMERWLELEPDGQLHVMRPPPEFHDGWCEDWQVAWDYVQNLRATPE
jgi:hypothetical protein